MWQRAARPDRAAPCRAA